MSPGEPLRAIKVLLRYAPIPVAVVLAGACEVASVNVLNPLPAPGAQEAGAVDSAVIDATSSHDAAEDAPSPNDAPSSVEGGDATAGLDGGECDFTSIGDPCTASSACCSGLCAADPTSKVDCRPTNGCLGAGRLCTSAGACCSLACTNDGTDYACSSQPLCAFAGGSCTSGADCCANQCGDTGLCVPTSAACKPAGESCMGKGDCCSSVCANASDGQERCALLQGCRVLGEICGGAGDCCSATCTPDSNGVGHCTALPSCATNDIMGCTAQMGDVCMNNNDCCSRQCLATSDGAMRCAPAGGCRTECELCGSNSDCCSGSCEAISETISVCQASGSCGHDGEGCMANPQCCAMGPGVGCIENPPAGGFHRCHSQPVPPPPDGGDPTGTSCALPDECSSGICVPRDGALACASSCVADGLPCTQRADCCDPFATCMVEQGELVCAPLIH